MPLTRGPDGWREASARRLLAQLELRTALNEGVGIVQAWNSCDQQAARHQLLAEHGSTGQDAEADRMIAFVDATANGRADPNAPWD